jgi:hypothetical protein
LFFGLQNDNGNNNNKTKQKIVQALIVVLTIQSKGEKKNQKIN